LAAERPSDGRLWLIANISAKEVEAVQRIAADLFRLSSSKLDAHVTTDALKEICDDSED